MAMPVRYNTGLKRCNLGRCSGGGTDSWAASCVFPGAVPATPSGIQPHTQLQLPEWLSGPAAPAD